ncbi:unnamed protein product [Ectocarpus sp. 4 AP-2014]
MATTLSDAAVEAANLALKMGSAAVDMISFIEGFGGELPVIGTVLKTLTAMRETVETVQQNRDELAALEKRCTYMTACVIVKFRQTPHAGSGPNVTPLEDCVMEAEKFAERRKKRRMVWKIVKAFGVKDELDTLNARIDRLVGDLGLAGIATVLGEVADLKGMLEQMAQNQAAARQELLANQEIIIDRLPKQPIKKADVPQGTPTRKSWHVERRHLMKTVVEALTDEAGPRLVGLVGDSGAGKTTAASEILPPEVRLPDDAVDLIDLCGRVAMDLAFVGRWSTVRGRHDRAAWSDAAAKPRTRNRWHGCWTFWNAGLSYDRHRPTGSTCTMHTRNSQGRTSWIVEMCVGMR